ncbi:MAG: NTP transferase domain-containing protein [Calditrichaceae bacterium]
MEGVFQIGIGKHPLIYGLLVSAGYSSRMGSYKPLLDYKGVPFIIEILMKMGQICEKIAVVTGFKGDELESKVNQFLENARAVSERDVKNMSGMSYGDLYKKIIFVHNPLFDEGMFGSLRSGLKALQNSDWLLYHFVDQPGLPAEFYTDFVTQLDGNYDWIQPKNRSGNGHPIFIGSTIYQSILAANRNTTLKEVSRMADVKKKYWVCGYPQILEDIDTPDDYNKLSL